MRRVSQASAFQTISKQFPQLLGQAQFGKVGEYVCSPAIDAALSSLWLFGCIDRNLRSNVYRLHRDLLGEYYSRLSDNLGSCAADIPVAAEALAEAVAVAVTAPLDALQVR